jgi:hypothetical protein
MNTNFSAQLLSEPALLASIQQAGISVNNNLLLSLVDMWIDKVLPSALFVSYGRFKDWDTYIVLVANVLGSFDPAI